MHILDIVNPHFRIYEQNKDVEKLLELTRNPDEKSCIPYFTVVGEYCHIVRLPHDVKHYTFVSLKLDQIKETTKNNKKLVYLFIFDDSPKDVYSWVFDTKQIALEYSFNNNIKTEPFIKVFTKYFCHLCDELSFSTFL